MANLDVTFTDDIPKIEREGFTRQSKYVPLLDACADRPGKAAKLTVDSQGQASSRASSIREAATKHPAETEGKGLFTVATRSGDGDNEFHVYTQFNEEGSEAYDEELKRRNRPSKSDTVEAEGEEAEVEPAPKPKKKAAKKKTA